MQITKRAIKGTFIVAASTYLIDIIALIRSIVLARLLIPEYFGIIALASFFFNLFRQLKEFNFDTALIHKTNPAADTFSTHFILKMALAVINFLIIIAISPILSRLYSPDIVKIILIFTFFSIFQEAASTPRMVLEKELLFNRVAMINIIKEITKTLVPIIMALKGFGLWSLVVMGVLDMVVPFLSFVITKTWKFSFRFNKEIAIWFLKFSSYMWFAGLCLMLMYQFDDFLVGTMVGAVALGLYDKAYEFSKLPVRMITHIINQVSLPLYSKLKEDKIELSRAFNNLLYIIVRLSFPFAILLFIIAPEFIYLFLGSKWSGSILLLRLLILYSILRSLYDDCEILLYGLGKPNISMGVVIAQTILMVVLCPVFIYFLGVNGAAILVDLMIIVGTLLIYKKISSFVDVEYRKNFMAPIISAMLGFLLVFVVFKIFYIPGIGQRLFLKLLLFLIIYLFVLMLIAGRELKDKFRYMFAALKQDY